MVDRGKELRSDQGLRNIARRSTCPIPSEWRRIGRWILATVSETLFVFAAVPVLLSAQRESCIPSLYHLKYPALALEQRIQGTVNISFVVDSSGKATQLESTAYPLLKSSVEEALELAPLLPACSGQRVSLQVRFLFDDHIDPLSAVSVKRVSDEVVEIIAPLEVVETTIADPAWIFTRRGRVLHRLNSLLAKLKFW